MGEILLDSEFLSDIGVDGEFYILEEQREQTLYTTTVVTIDGDLLDNDSDDPTRLSGNIAQGHGAGIYNEGLLEVTQNIYFSIP